MSFLDDAKNLADKAEDTAADHKDKIKDGLDKGADFAKDKVGDQHAGHVDTGVEAAKDQVDKLQKD